MHSTMPRLSHLFDPDTEIGAALRASSRTLVHAGLLSAVINLLLLVPSLFMLHVYDSVLSSRNATTLAMLTLITLVLFGLYGVLEWKRSQVLVRVGVVLDLRLSARVFQAAYHRTLNRGPVNPAQAAQDLANLRQFMAGTGTLAVLDAPWTPVFLIVITLLNVWLGVFAVAAMLCLIALTWVNELVTHKLLARSNQQASQANTLLAHQMRQTEPAQAMGLFAVIHGIWDTLQKRVLAYQTLASERGAVTAALSKTARMVFQSLILGLGAWLVILNQLSPGGMIAASILLGRALAPVDQLLTAWKQWVAVRVAHERLNELLQSEPAPQPRTSLPPLVGHVAFEAVTATPPGTTEPVLRDINFVLPAGQVLVVMGPSGSGKSTLARLITGVWPVTSGHVRLDGADVAAWNPRERGAQTGYLPQDAGLFDATVAGNIARLGSTPMTQANAAGPAEAANSPAPEPAVDGAGVVRAAQEAGAHEFILRLRQGYETPVGPDGMALSGGQRQRVALARALYGQPRLVVLDEPDAHLDDEGQRALGAALGRLRQRGATVVLIAHGPALLPLADRLLVLNEGRLLLHGPRDQVLAHMRQQIEKASPANVAPASEGHA